ncbi:ABC-type transport auxiliary lipoprotein family protein [Polynucleobacter sp. IMCC 30228]|uniref:ABC-type transport auxiliary lipoprotein family protein n=1 Tax=Polynucleobacter sp. IMCC 30228 TaxID=2781011 RepID=UPI001F419848|nr:ABC-type transport auxiliary lipoprotein family protein [Polynucleobacter sp. IMCC 30228]MCE7526984.1 PqiC family protein [Polynucleobacter sp. IMCC 30228]
MIFTPLQQFPWQGRRSLRSAGLVLIASACVVLFNACAPTKPAEQTSDWLVSVKRSGEPRKPISPVWLKVGTISVTAPFDGKSLVYRLSEGRYDKDFYNAYIALPNEMFANATRTWLNDAGVFRLTVDQSNSFFPYYTLQAHVEEFYGDYRTKPEAVVTIQYFLSAASTSKAANPVIFTPRYSQRIALADNSRAALIQGYQQALTAILQQLEADFYQKNLQLPTPLGK